MKTAGTLLSALLLSTAIAAAASSGEGPAYQVADIAPNTPVQNQGGTVLPGFFQPVTAGDVFLAPAGSSHPSIWRTDGTPEGTRPVVAGSVIGGASLVGSNGQVAFAVGSDGTGTTAVWATDGTSAGTVFLQGGLVPPSDPYEDLLVVEGRLFFHDFTPQPFAECVLWISDGTVAGTERLAQLGGQAKGLSGSDGLFYFLAPIPDGFEYRLWRSDGTPEGTVPLREFENDGSSFDVASIGGEALIAAEKKLWLTHGDAVDPIADLGDDTFVWFFDARIQGEALYFLARPMNSGTALTVWRSDGTAAGTSPVLSAPVSMFSPTISDPWVQQLGSRVYYMMPGVGPDSYDLWSSDVEGENAQPVSCAGCSSIPRPGWMVASGDELYFSAAAEDVHTIWAVDSTGIPRPLKSFCTGYCNVFSAVAVDGGAMISLWPNDGGELWSTDGTTAGTQLVGSFETLFGLYSSPSLNAVLFPAAVEFPQETTLWMSRLTPASLQQLIPLEGEGSAPRNLRRAGDRVVFEACGEEQGGRWGAGAHDYELLKEGDVNCSFGATSPAMVSDGDSVFFQYGNTQVWATGGTEASTRMVWDGDSGSVGYLLELVGGESGVAFWSYRFADDQRIDSFWRSDGTAAGTTKAFDMPIDAHPGYGTTALGDEFYFLAQSPEQQVWRTDGTPQGTRRLTDAESGEFWQQPEFIRVGAFVYFTGRHGIWRTDGTAAGTSLAIPGPVDDDPYGSDRLSWLHQQGGVLLFQRMEGGTANLWRSLGDAGPAEPLADLDPTDYDPRAAASFAGQLYFAADDGAHGVELWRTDGSAAGTTLFRDFAPSASSGNPREMVVAGGRLFFTAAEVATGTELWSTDGSAGGTRRVQDIAPDAGSSAPAELTQAGDLLYFSADNGVTGRELWALPLGEAPTGCVPGDEQLCLNDGRFRIEVEWSDFAGNSGQGRATALSADTGYFWFFDESIVELIVKVVDGRDINGHFWVYYGSLSNVEFDVTITDTETDESRTYHNPSGTFASVGDIEAFPLGESAIASAAWKPAEASAAQSFSAPAGSCLPTGTRLCLLDGRFAVEAEWTDFEGNSGYGAAVSITPDTGYFWFFSPSVVEVVAKLVDGRPVNGKFWVFYGALSNVEYKLTVTDTVTGFEREYRNASGEFASVGDNEAF